MSVGVWTLVWVTWLDTGLCLRPGLLSSSSSCLRLKLETPRDFTSPVSLQASKACWGEKDLHPLTDSDYLYRRTERVESHMKHSRAEKTDLWMKLGLSWNYHIQTFQCRMLKHFRNWELNGTHLPCCTEVCVVVDVFSILVYWIELFSRLIFKQNSLFCINNTQCINNSALVYICAYSVQCWSVVVQLASALVKFTSQHISDL